MTFNPKNFRRITDESKPSFKIRTADDTTLILIKANGDAMYGRKVTDKDKIIEDCDHQTDLLLWAWVGQYRTDIFLLTLQDLEAHYQ